MSVLLAIVTLSFMAGIFGLVLGYGYRLHQRWAVDVRYNQGLFDLTYDDFFKNTRTLLNSDL